ncbi:hypothetical protein H0H92_001149 [Tricholoma furcatifolium]|nr:hypothetical protein H0H92_001149 [Tricholoma furcatifolium]
MLAVRPPPRHYRGRSSDIPHAARARVASEQRQRQQPILHTPPLATDPLDYYDRPPSPPRSLEDQVHVAYAHEDFHLAKILLLRLKGIHVTGNDDPRIAQVKDEDFDFCFVPFGPLLDEEEEKALKERQRAEMERVAELQRVQRLKDCEKIWELGKNHLRDMKILALRRKELEEKRRDREHKSPSSDEYRPSDVESPVPRRLSRHIPTRTVVAYRLAAPASPPEPELFVYDAMPTCSITRPASRPQTLSQTKSSSPFARSLFDDSRAVLFSEVLSSMQGPLFPPERRPTSSNRDSRKLREAELLDSLLAVVDHEGRRSRKGKAPVRPTPRRKDSSGAAISPCAACSSSSLLSSTSSSSSRRSWLSFSSASSSSASTAATTPSSSPPPSSVLQKAAPQSKSWFRTSRRTQVPPPVSIAIPPPCRCCTSHFTPVSPADAPLPILSDVAPYTKTLRSSGTNVTMSTDVQDDAAVEPSSLVLRHFVQLFEIAKGFQQAYVSAAMFAIPSAPSLNDTALDDRRATASLLARMRAPELKSRRFRTLYPPGARARSGDVRVFLNGSSADSDEAEAARVRSQRPIPLRALDEDEDPEDHVQWRTILPNPLPYTLKFAPLPVPPRCPWRAVNGPVVAKQRGASGQGPVVFRVRSVENPFFYRVKALEGAMKGRSRSVVMYAGVRGVGVGAGTTMGSVWVGGSDMYGGVGARLPREGTLGSGREKVFQIAFEGIGGSSLRFEVKPSGQSETTVVRGRGRERGVGGERPQVHGVAMVPMPRVLMRGRSGGCW